MTINEFKLFERRNYFQENSDSQTIRVYEGDILTKAEKNQITFAIPTYRRASELKECIESILHQNSSFRAYEILVVDDYPVRDDETEMMMSSYQGNVSIRYYKNSRNVGQAGNMNNCFRLANSEWVVIINDDDILHRDYLRKLLPCLKNNVDGVLFNSVIFNNIGELPVVDNPDFVELTKMDLRYNFLFPEYCSSGCVFRKTTVLQLGGFSGVTVGPDINIARFCYYSRIYRSNQKLVYYRVGVNISFKPETLEGLCQQRHVSRKYIWRRIGIPGFLIRKASLYADYIFNKSFRETWNSDFVSSFMKDVSEKDILKSKFYYTKLNRLVRYSKKYFNKKIYIGKV